MAVKKTSSRQTKPKGETAAGEGKSGVLALPPEWPGAFAAYKYSKQAVRLNLKAVAGWLVISVVVSIAISLLDRLHSLDASTRGLLAVVSYLLAPLFAAILAKVTIASVRRRQVGFSEAFSQGVPYWLNAIVLSILVGITEVVSFVLLIIPFFFVWPRLSLATYFLVDKDLGPLEAYKASWEATKGYALFIYGILGAQIAMGLLAVTVIGIPFAIYFLIMYGAAHAVLYEVIGKSGAKSPVEA
jgi:hypothetical protein